MWKLSRNCEFWTWAWKGVFIMVLLGMTRLLMDWCWIVNQPLCLSNDQKVDKLHEICSKQVIFLSGWESTSTHVSALTQHSRPAIIFLIGRVGRKCSVGVAAYHRLLERLESGEWSDLGLGIWGCDGPEFIVGMVWIFLWDATFRIFHKIDEIGRREGMWRE